MNIIERARKKKKVTREQMARDLEWSYSTVQRYEKKVIMPQLDKAYKMAKYLDIDLEKLARYFIK